MIDRTAPYNKESSSPKCQPCHGLRHASLCIHSSRKRNCFWIFQDSSCCHKTIEISWEPYGLPKWYSDKEPTCPWRRCRDLASISRTGRSPGRGHGNTLQYSPLEIPWAEDLGRLQSMGSVGHDWACTHTWEPYTLVIKSLLESESLILNSVLPFCPLESYWASIFLSLNLVSKSCSCGMIEWDNVFKVLHTVLVTQYGVAAEAAAIVAILLIIFYYSASRIRYGFTKKPVKLKPQSPSFCLGPFQWPIPFCIQDFTLLCRSPFPPPCFLSLLNELQALQSLDLHLWSGPRIKAWYWDTINIYPSASWSA